MRGLKRGDTVKLNVSLNWMRALIFTIDEVKTWGIVCYADMSRGRFYYRASWKEIKEMAEPKDYKHIKAWGQMMGSFPSYIKSQQYLAANTNAPLDAVFQKEGVWTRFSEVENESSRAVVQHYLARMEGSQS